MQQHKCAELNIKTHFKDMKRIEMHCSKVLVLSILRKPIVLQPNQLCLLSSCHHNKGFDADFLQKHRRRRALKSSSNGHLLHVIDSVITCHCTACKLLHLFESHWTSTIFCIGIQIPDLSVNRRAIYQKDSKNDFLLSVSVPSFIPPSLILRLVSLLKAVRGHYGKGHQRTGAAFAPTTNGTVCAWVTQTCHRSMNEFTSEPVRTWNWCLTT